MIASENSILSGSSGTLQNLVIRKVGNKTIVSAAPNMSRRKLSAKQKAANERMQEAIATTKHITRNPRVKQRTSEMLKVTPNKVFRAIVKQYLLSDGNAAIFQQSPEEKRNEQTLTSMKKILLDTVAESEIKLFGDRAKGAYETHIDWNLLVLTPSDVPKNIKSELLDKLFEVTLKEGATVNLILAQKDKWANDPEFELLRKRIEGELVRV